MSTRMKWVWGLVLAGSFAMLIGAVDPLEGAIVILIGGGSASAGVYLAQTRMRRLVYGGFILTVLSFVLLVVMSVLGGIGGSDSFFRSKWWGLLLLPYPIGWILAMVGTAFALAELIPGRWGWAAAGIWILASVGMLVRLGLLLSYH